MTTEQCSILIAAIGSCFPNWYSKLSTDDLVRLSDMWASIMEDVPFDVAQQAAKELLGRSSEWPPNVGMVNTRARELMKINLKEPEWDAARAWAAVCAAIRPFGYGASWDAEARAQLPPHIVQCAEDYGIYRIAMRLTEDEPTNFAQWRDTFNIRNERHERDKNVSPAVRQMIAEVTSKLRLGAPKDGK